MEKNKQNNNGNNNNSNTNNSNNKCGNWNFGNWKLNSRIGKLEFQKLGIKFGNRNFEGIFKDRIFEDLI